LRKNTRRKKLHFFMILNHKKIYLRRRNQKIIMKKFTILLLFNLLTIFAIAQNSTLKGNVSDADGEPAIHANVIVDVSKGWAGVTDFDGNYKITLPPGPHTVLFRYIGKEDKIVKINLTAGETKTQNIKFSDKIELMNTVVVSGSKYAKKLSEETVSMEVLKSDLLEQNNITSAEDGLSKVPGVVVTGDGQASIRGGSGWSYGAGSRVLVLYDGLPLLSAEGGDAKWGLIPMENLETMEVIKGAASSIYGSGALNGVINFRTSWAKNEPETKFNVWNGITHSPRNKNEAWWYDQNQVPFETGFNFVHKRKFGRTDFVWHGQYNNDNSHLQFGGGGSARFGQKFRFRPEKYEGLSMGINVNAYRGWGTNFFLWNGADSLARVPLDGTASAYQTTRVIIDPFISYYDKKNNNFSFKLRYFNSKNENDTPGQGSIPVNYFGEFQYNRYFQKIKFNLVAGLSGFADVVNPEDPNVQSLSGKNRRYNLAPFVQLEKKFFAESLNLTMGMRYEYFRMKSIDRDVVIKGTLNRPLFRFGANYKAAEYTYLRASYGEGYRFPSIAESFVNLNLGGIGIFPNPRLEEETGWYTEIGIKQGFPIGENWKGYTDLTFFAMRYNNMIEVNFGSFGDLVVPTPENPNPSALERAGLGFSFQNVGQTLIMGGEITVAGEGKIGNVPLTILAGYTFTRPKSLNWDEELTLYDVNGEVLEIAPSRTGDITYQGTSSGDRNILKYRNPHVFTLDMQSTFKKVDFGISIQYRSWMENIDYAFTSNTFTQEITNPDLFGAFQELKDFRERYEGRGTTLLSARIIYRFTEKASLGIVGNNLLNLTYADRPGLLGQPINFNARFSYAFTGKSKVRKEKEKISEASE
jgi:iron complex outermembrane receptor protein